MKWLRAVLRAGALVALLVALAAPEVQAQTLDTTATVRLDRSPRGALWRSMAVPGWGQFYNRQYCKMPFVYLALGGLTFAAINLNDEYILYRRAFQYKAFEEQLSEGETNPRQSFEDEYNEVVAQFGFEISSGPLEGRRDNLRRNRDLTFLGIGLVYMLATLDAFVSAHLADFDVGEDLTFSVQPDMGRGGVTATLRLNL